MIYMYKAYAVRPHKPSPSLYEIGVGDIKGVLPEALKGLFTARPLACKAIDDYLQSKIKVEDTNGESSKPDRSK